MGVYLSWRMAAAVLFVVMALATPSLAQLQTATLYGKVTDSSGAVLPGVNVTLTSAQLIRGTETRVTDNAGEWRMPGLPPGTYVVSGELAGFSTAKREGVAINPGAQLRVDLVLAISTLEETVTVTGESVVDVRSTSLQHTIDEDLISALPIQRTYSDLVTTMPGVTEGGKYTYALTQTVLGSSARDNEFMLDGQSTKISVGYSASEFSIEAMDQVQVTTSGVSAEFGQASGGVFSFVSKSGGDTFRGTSYYYLIDDAIQSNNVSSDLQAQGVQTGNEVIRDWNWGANLGGPIMRKRVWFFTDFNKMAYEQTQAGWPTAELRTQLGSDANIHEQRRLIFVKGTWQVSPNNNFASTYNHQRRWMLPSNPGADYRVDPRSWRKQFWLPQTFSERWMSVLGQNTVVEVQGGYLKVIEDNTFPLGSFDPSEVNGYQDSGSGVNYGTWDRQRGRDDARDHWDIRGSLSYFKEKFAGGSHELKTGVHRQYNWNTTWNVIPNNFQQLLRSPSACLSLTCAVPFEIVLFNGPNASESYSTVWAGYIQDQWNLPRQRLTLNIGVRYEHADSGNPERRNGNVTPSGFDPDLDGVQTTFPTIDWFPSHVWPAREHVLVQSSIAPRVGVSWDPAGNSRFVLKGMYGRYFDKPPTAPGGGVNFSARHQWLDCRNAADTPISCQGLPAGQVNGDKRFVNGEQGALVTSNVITPEELTSTPVDADLDYSYMDSLNIGFESALSPTVSVSISGIYKRSGGFTGNVDPLRPFDTAYDSVEVTNPVTNAPMTIFLERPEVFSLLRQNFLTNLPENKRIYKGLELVVRKRWDNRWQLLGSYLYGRAEGTLGQHYNDSAGRNLTNPNNLINDYGPLSLDSPHTFKVNGSYLARGGINLAVSYLGISGVPTNSIAAELSNFYAGATYFQFLRGVHYPATNPQGVTYRETSVTVPAEPRGAHRVDFRSILNLRVEKTFNLGNERRVGVMLDLLNTSNSSAVTHIQSSRREFVNYLLPEAIESPRRARVGLRFSF